MNTRTSCHAVLFTVLLVVGFLSPVQAEDIAPAHGRVNATLGCDMSPDGLRVTVLDEMFRNEFRAQHGIDIALGDLCLPPLAGFPWPFPSLLAVAPLTPNAGAAKVDIADCLIWILDGANVSQSNVTGPGFGTFAVKQRQVVACDVDEGRLETTLVDSLGPADASHIGNRCGSTLSALTATGARASSPITGVLGVDGTGTAVGGLMWALAGHNYMEVMVCNLNAAQDELVVVHRETNDGIDETAVGGACLEALASSEAAGHQITSGPIPLPQGHATDDPGCLRWIVDGGTRLETPKAP